MKLKKGCYGYLKKQRKWETIKTIIDFTISGAIFAMGYFTTGTKTNLLTIGAVLGCLPACKSAVIMFMYLKAKSCSGECYEKLQPYVGNTLMLYDLYLTSYEKNYQISAMAVKNSSLCGYTEDGKCDLTAGEKHISEILKQDGYEGLTIKLFSNFSKFTDRLLQMESLSDKSEKKEVAIAEIIKSISL